MNIKDLIAQNMEKILNPTKVAIARNKDRVLGKERENVENKKQVSTILYVEATIDVEVFKSFGWKLRDEYNKHGLYGITKAGPVVSGREIVKAINSKNINSLKRLDIIGHGGVDGIYFKWENPPENLSEAITLIPLAGQSFEIIAAKRNFYKNSISKTDDAQYATIDGVATNTPTNRQIVIGLNAASLDDINFNVFSENAVIEFHACNTAGRPSYENWNDTNVWEFKYDNLAYWASIQLYSAGKNKAVSIGHYAGAGPEGNWLSSDYRQNRRIVYHNGKVIIETNKRGDLWDEISVIMQ